MYIKNTETIANVVFELNQTDIERMLRMTQFEFDEVADEGYVLKEFRSPFGGTYLCFCVVRHELKCSFVFELRNIDDSGIDYSEEIYFKWDGLKLDEIYQVKDVEGNVTYSIKLVVDDRAETIFNEQLIEIEKEVLAKRYICPYCNHDLREETLVRRGDHSYIFNEKTGAFVESSFSMDEGYLCGDCYNEVDIERLGVNVIGAQEE